MLDLDGKLTDEPVNSQCINLTRLSTAVGYAVSVISLHSHSTTTSMSTSVSAPLSSVQLFTYLYLFRLLNTLLCRTFFQPDEFYQSLEIAHHHVFGYGFVSWEWRNALDGSTGGIRSSIYPLVFVPGYALLKCLRLDDTYLLVSV